MTDTNHFVTGKIAKVLLASVLVAGFAARAQAAEEPKGCDGFKWPLKTEATLLLTPNLPVVKSGSAATFDGKPYSLSLVDFDGAALPKSPERMPKVKPSHAGFATFAVPAAGAYQITISKGAWIDVIQKDHYIKPSAFSGATDCPGVRKSIRVNLEAAPLTLQISGTQEASINIVVTPINAK